MIKPFYRFYYTVFAEAQVYHKKKGYFYYMLLLKDDMLKAFL